MPVTHVNINISIIIQTVKYERQMSGKHEWSFCFFHKNRTRSANKKDIQFRFSHALYDTILSFRINIKKISFFFNIYDRRFGLVNISNISNRNAKKESLS